MGQTHFFFFLTFSTFNYIYWGTVKFLGRGEFKSNPLLVSAGKNNWYKTILSLFLQFIFLILVSASLGFLLFRRRNKYLLCLQIPFWPLKTTYLIYSTCSPFNKTRLMISPSGLCLQIYVFKSHLACNEKQSGLSYLKSSSHDCW